MKKHYLLKGVAFVLTFCLLILLYPIPSHAENAEWEEYTYETTRDGRPALEVHRIKKGQAHVLLYVDGVLVEEAHANAYTKQVSHTVHDGRNLQDAPVIRKNASAGFTVTTRHAASKAPLEQAEIPAPVPNPAEEAAKAPQTIDTSPSTPAASTEITGSTSSQTDEAAIQSSAPTGLAAPLATGSIADAQPPSGGIPSNSLHTFDSVGDQDETSPSTAPNHTEDRPPEDENCTESHTADIPAQNTPDSEDSSEAIDLPELSSPQNAGAVSYPPLIETDSEPLTSNAGLTAAGDGWYSLGWAGGYIEAPYIYGNLQRQYSTSSERVHVFNFELNETRITVMSIIEAVLTTTVAFHLIQSGVISFTDVMGYIVDAITFINEMIYETQTVEVDALHYTYNYRTMVNGNSHYTSQRQTEYVYTYNKTTGAREQQYLGYTIAGALHNSDMVESGIDHYLATEHTTHVDCPICPICGIQRMGYSHLFSGTYEATPAQHIQTCIRCGIKEPADHIFSPAQKNDAQTHKRTCAVCGYIEMTNHAFGAYSTPLGADIHQRTCSGCGYIDSGAHTWVCSSVSASQHAMTCSVCQATSTVNHTWGSYAMVSNSQHRRACTANGCTQIETSSHTITSTRPLTEAGQEGYHENYCATCGGRWNETHTYGSYTDSSASVHVRTCTKCGKENYQAHSWGSYSSTGSTQHKRTCTVSTCGRTQTSNHSWSGYSYLSATYHRRTCSACAASQNASHSISSVTSVDGTNHQNYCATCNGYWKVAHTLTVLTPYGNATKHLAGCTKCNYNIGQNHTFDAWVNYSSSLHRHQCTGCKEYHTASHGSYGSWASYSSSQHRRKCGSCSYYQYGNHGSYGSWTNYSSSQHRRKCGSCAYYQYGNHSYGSNSYYSSTQHRKKCTSCPRYVYANHSYQYSGGYLRCSGCGHEKPYA